VPHEKSRADESIPVERVALWDTEML
jgi:hypothetical protein